MSKLTTEQIQQYHKEGYVAPIEILTREEALEVRNEIELIENRFPNELDNSGRYNVHLISQKLDVYLKNNQCLNQLVFENSAYMYHLHFCQIVLVK